MRWDEKVRWIIHFKIFGFDKTAKNVFTSLTTYQIACFAIRKLAERLEDTYQCTILLLIAIKKKKRWHKIIISFEKIKLMQQLQKKVLTSIVRASAEGILLQGEFWFLVAIRKSKVFQKKFHCGKDTKSQWLPVVHLS